MSESESDYLPKINECKEFGSRASCLAILKESGLNSTSHGLPHAVRAKSWHLRLIWIVCFLASSGYCLYYTALIIMDYLNYPVISNINVVNELPTSFPTVMICNLNPFDTDSDVTIGYMEYCIGKMPIPAGFNPYDYFIYSSETLKAATFYQKPEMQNTVGYTMDKMLISCLFAGSKCDSSNFEQVYMFDYINCFKFNSNGSLMVGKRGFTNGLVLELYLGNSSSPKNSLYSIRNGLRFMVMNESLSTPQIYDLGYDAAPGLITNVEVKKYYYDTLGAPYSDCLDDLTPNSSGQTTLMKYMFQKLNQKQYDQIYCQNLCFQVVVMNVCNCFMVRYPYVENLIEGKNVSYCSPTDSKECANDVINNLIVHPASCNADCPNACEFYNYDTTVSTSEYMSDWYWSRLKNYSANFASQNNNTATTNQLKLFDRLSRIQTVQEARESTLLINIYLNQLGYTSIVETPFYSTNSFLAAIGGNLGLFVGISFLSFVEIFEIVYLMMQVFIEKQVQNALKRRNKIEAKKKRGSSKNGLVEKGSDA